MGVEVR